MSSKNDLMQDLLYMQQLQPDEGYQIDFAVGCTFSLNMEGLISVPLAFSRLGDPKDLTKQTALYLMEGILRCCDKFVLFCNKGFMKVPNNCQPLYSLMDKSVVEVSSLNTPLANFHPKMWVIRQKPLTDGGANIIKLIVLSRNLTFTNDLEVALSLKGYVTKNGINERNVPLADMLRDLADEYDTNDERKKKIKRLAKDFERVVQFDLEFPFSPTVYELYPSLFLKSGSRKNYNRHQLQNDKHQLKKLQGKRVLIISPFLDNDSQSGIASEIIQKADEKYLVTRDNNVTQDILDMFNEVYVPNPNLIDNDIKPIDLHAKIYLVEQENRAVYLYLGSTNATNSAFQRNAEMYIGIRVKEGCGFEQLFDELVKNDERFITINEPAADVEEKERRKMEGDMEHMMRWAMNSLDSAKTNKNQDTNKPPYHIELKFVAVDKQKYEIEKCFLDYSVKVRPLQCENSYIEIELKRKKKSLQWDMQLEQLSEFYVVEVVKLSDETCRKSGVCKVDTDGLQRFVEQRKEKIVNSIVNRDNIMQYIDMMLSDFPEYTFEEWNQRYERTGLLDTNNHDLWREVTIYEQLLKASYENPSKLEELKKVLTKLPEDEFPNELKPILKAFGIIIKRKKQ